MYGKSNHQNSAKFYASALLPSSLCLTRDIQNTSHGVPKTKKAIEKKKKRKKCTSDLAKALLSQKPVPNSIHARQSKTQDSKRWFKKGKRKQMWRSEVKKKKAESMLMQNVMPEEAKLNESHMTQTKVFKQRRYAFNRGDCKIHMMFR